jgi:hypothetical protein
MLNFFNVAMIFLLKNLISRTFIKKLYYTIFKYLLYIDFNNIIKNIFHNVISFKVKQHIMLK